MLKKNLISILVSVLLLCLVGMGYAGLVFESEIPEVDPESITIDGNPEDWEGIQPFLMDDVGDPECEEGTDIKEIYLAKDSEYIYWRMDTVSGHFSYDNGRYVGLGISGQHISEPGQENYPYAVMNWISTIDEGSIVLYDSSGPHFQFSNPAYGKVDLVAEGKIPLSYLIDPDINYNVIGASSHSGEPNKICDNLQKIYVSEPQPSYHIGVRWVQHRVYEDGRVLKYVVFQLLDESNNYVPGDIVDDVKLFDPDGYEVTITNLEFWTYKLAFSHYDGWIGRWFYNPFQQVYEYKGEIDEDFKVGTYRFEVTDINGDVFEAYFAFNGVIHLPLISSRTIKTRFDRFGNFIAKWAVPYYLNPELETSVRAMIMIYDDDEWIGAQYVLVPTHMGRLFVPSEVVDMTKAEGNRFELVIQLRTNNFDSRIYSNPRKLPLWSINMPPWRLKD